MEIKGSLVQIREAGFFSISKKKSNKKLRQQRGKLYIVLKDKILRRQIQSFFGRKQLSKDKEEKRL